MSNRSQQLNHRQQYSYNGFRHCGHLKNICEERHSDIHSDSHYKHCRNAHSSMQTETHRKRSQDYSNSPKRRHSNNGTGKDRSKKSPEGAHSLSPDLYAHGNKKQRLGAYDDKHWYRQEPKNEMYSAPHQSFSLQHHNHPKYFKCLRTQKVKTDSQLSHLKQEHGDYRSLTADQLNRKISKRSRETIEQKTTSMKDSKRSSGKYIEKDKSRSPDNHPLVKRSSLNEPYGECLFKPLKKSPTAPEEKSHKGFQRFLDLLNKGVNVDMLTKIVTLHPENDNDCQQSTVFLKDSLYCPLSRHSFEEQYDDCLSQRIYIGQPDNGIFSRSRSPLVMEKKATLPEEQKQLQGVLKAIGFDLGSEELDQMSNRIQERLYGKKDNDQSCCLKESEEGCSKHGVFLTNQRRSFSSNGSTGDSCLKNDSCATQGNGTLVQQIQVIQRVINTENRPRVSMQDSKEIELNFHDNAETMETFSTAKKDKVAEPTFGQLLGMHRPVDCSHQSLAVPSILPIAPSPNLIPTIMLSSPRLNHTSLPTRTPAPQLDHSLVGLKAQLPEPQLVSQPFLPPVLPQFSPQTKPTVIIPPNLVCNSFPSASIFPTVFSQTLSSQMSGCTQSHFFSPLNASTTKLDNSAQKSKTRPRTRCLQVIQTKSV